MTMGSTRRRFRVTWPGRKTWIAVAVAVAVIPVVTLAIAVGPDVADIVASEMDRARRARSWPERVQRQNWPALRAEGEAIVSALELHREATGRYPDRLAQLNDLQPGWSDWRYELDEAGEPYLWIGEYDCHMFEISWSSTSGWYVDT